MPEKQTSGGFMLLNADFVAILEKGFPREAEQIINFLRRGFSDNGQIAISSVFLYAQDSAIAPARVLAALEKEWVRNWKFQHPEMRGNPDAPGALGMQNIASFENIYRDLNIPSPLSNPKPSLKRLDTRNLREGTTVEIRTRNSVYTITFVDPKNNKVVFRGGKNFPGDTEGEFEGSEILGRKTPGCIVKDANLWICYDPTREDGNLRTSDVLDYKVIPPR